MEKVMEIKTTKTFVNKLSESVVDDLFQTIYSLRINKKKKERLVHLIMRYVYFKFVFEKSKEMTEEESPIRQLNDKLKSVFGNDINILYNI
jgi:hypothetical protein